MMSSSVTISSEPALIPAAQATSIRLFMGFFIFKAGAKSAPVKNNYAGCQQLQRLVPTYSHASANSAAYTDSPQNQSESQKNKILNLRCVCWSLPGGTSTDACQAPVSCPSPMWLHATRHNRVRLNLLHLLSLISCRTLAETEVKLPPLWFCCFSSSHSGRVWQTHSHTCTN